MDHQTSIIGQHVQRLFSPPGRTGAVRASMDTFAKLESASFEAKAVRLIRKVEDGTHDTFSNVGDDMDWSFPTHTVLSQIMCKYCLEIQVHHGNNMFGRDCKQKSASAHNHCGSKTFPWFFNASKWFQSHIHWFLMIFGSKSFASNLPWLPSLSCLTASAATRGSLSRLRSASSSATWNFSCSVDRNEWKVPFQQDH